MVYSKRVSPAALVLLLLASALAAGCGDGAGMTLREAGESVLEAYPIEAPSPPERNRPDRFANLPADAEADSHPASASRAGPYGSRPASAGKGDKASGPPEGFVDPITRDADRVPITLEGCLRRALVGNLKVQIARFGPAIAETYVVEAEALFDPAWFLNNALGRVRQDAGSFLLGAATLVTKQWEFDTGVETLLPTGGTVALSQDWTYIDSNSAFFMPNPQYDTDLNLEVRQPLLRGGGPGGHEEPDRAGPPGPSRQPGRQRRARTAAHERSRLERAVAARQREDTRQQILLEVSRAVRDLAAAEESILATRAAREAAEQTLRDQRANVAAGAAPRPGR